MLSKKNAEVVESEQTKRDSLARKYILVIIVLTTALFGLPIWYGTTSIYRAELPVKRIYGTSNDLTSDLKFKIPIYLDIPNSQQRLIPKTQQLIDREIEKLNPNLGQVWAIELKRGKATEDDYSIKLEKTSNDQESIFISPFTKETTIFLSEKVITENIVDDFIMRVIIYDIFYEEIIEINKILTGFKEDKSVIVPYDSNFNIVFSLFVESGVPVTWNITSALSSLQPMLNTLGSYANFTIDTQIQYYSQLTHYPKYDESSKSYVLNEADISTFVNYGDWNLITTDSKPTLNFIIYVPESSIQGIPFLIENSNTNSFLIPQWGGVHILNKNYEQESVISADELLPIMEIFSSQLFQLLGATSTPKSPFIRMDILSRLTVFKNIKQSLENLKSLVKLTSSLKHISIPDFTLKYVLGSLDCIKQSINSITSQNWAQAMEFSSKAIKNSNSAFFEKGMVQQAYFPDEHKLAVYLPLLGPILSITALGLIKMLKDLRSAGSLIKISSLKLKNKKE